LDFDAEKQFSSSNYQKLSDWQTIPREGYIFPEQMDSLIKDLEGDLNFIPIQKSKTKLLYL